ncbi:MAG TPA: hypothetical protein VL574_14140 [Stellaceae bacterium]|nr:hypothetical protein [Stellaceae bacterium]
MSDEAFHIGDRALFDRLKALGLPGGSGPVAPQEGQGLPEGEDLMYLAAWMERRAEGGSHDTENALTETVEAMLAADPTLLDDVVALTPPLPPDLPSPDFLARVQALVPPQDAAAVVVPFRLSRSSDAVQPQKPRNVWLSWGALAACLACIAVVGFNMGIEAEQNINTSTDQMSIDILDAPNAVLDGTS